MGGVSMISDDGRTEEEILDRLIQENQGNPEAVEILRTMRAEAPGRQPQ